MIIDFAPGAVVGVDVTDSGATITAGAGCATLTLHRVRCNVSSGDLINASLGDGNDILSISPFFDSGGGRLSVAMATIGSGETTSRARTRSC